VAGDNEEKMIKKIVILMSVKNVNLIGDRKMFKKKRY